MKDAIYYRLMEVLPAFLAWGTFILMFVLSIFLPVWVAFFIILFDLYWLLKTVYLSLHLRSSFSKMKENMKINWLEKLKGDNKLKDWQNVYHLIILPMYNEDYEVVRESFLRLTEINYPVDKMIVVLGLEERAGDINIIIKEKIEKEFGDKFYRFLVTIHLENLSGEKPGKGSNEAWAGKIVKENIIDREKIKYEDVLVSVFDVDTQVYKEYFGNPARLRFLVSFLLMVYL